MFSNGVVEADSKEDNASDAIEYIVNPQESSDPRVGLYLRLATSNMDVVYRDQGVVCPDKETMQKVHYYRAKPAWYPTILDLAEKIQNNYPAIDNFLKLINTDLESDTVITEFLDNIQRQIKAVSEEKATKMPKRKIGDDDYDDSEEYNRIYLRRGPVDALHYYLPAENFRMFHLLAKVMPFDNKSYQIKSNGFIFGSAKLYDSYKALQAHIQARPALAKLMLAMPRDLCLFFVQLNFMREFDAKEEEVADAKISAQATEWEESIARKSNEVKWDKFKHNVLVMDSRSKEFEIFFQLNSEISPLMMPTLGLDRISSAKGRVIAEYFNHEIESFNNTNYLAHDLETYLFHLKVLKASEPTTNKNLIEFKKEIDGMKTNPLKRELTILYHALCNPKVNVDNHRVAIAHFISEIKTYKQNPASYKMKNLQKSCRELDEKLYGKEPIHSTVRLM